MRGGVREGKQCETFRKVFFFKKEEKEEEEHRKGEGKTTSTLHFDTF